MFVTSRGASAILQYRSRIIATKNADISAALLSWRQIVFLRNLSSEQRYSVNCWRYAYDQKILSPKEKKTQDEARIVDSCLEFLSRLQNSHNLGNIHWVAYTSNRSFYSPHCFTPLRSACPRWLFIARLKLQTTPKVLRPKSNVELHMNLSRCTRVKFDRWEKRRT